MNAKAARAIKTVFYALDVVNQGMQEKQSITVRCMDIEDLEKQADDDVMLLLKLIFHRQDTQELLKKMLEREKPETP